MAEPLRRRRVGWPTVLMLLALLGAALLMAHEAREGRGARPERFGRPAFPEHAGPDTYRHHQWARIPTSTGGEGPDPNHLDAVYDPQRSSMEQAFGRFDGGGAALPFSPHVWLARIVSSEGAPAAADAECDVRVLPMAHRRFNCLARVRCAGHILYPNPSQTAGYVSCELENGEPRRIVDLGHTALDGDPMVRIDLRTGRVTVEDRGDRVDAFRVTLERVEPTP